MLPNKTGAAPSAPAIPATVKQVLETEWFTLETVTYKSSSENPYYRMSGKDSVAIIALTPERKMVLIRQFRPAVGISLIEMPSGSVDDGEVPEKAIRRELLEETGYACDSISYVGAFRAEPCRINSEVHLFIGQGAKVVSAEKSGEEIEEVILATEEEFKKMVATNQFIVAPGIGFYGIAKMKGFL